MVESPLSVGEALAAGAHGYLLENANNSEMLTFIRIALTIKRFMRSEVNCAYQMPETHRPNQLKKSAASTRLPFPAGC